MKKENKRRPNKGRWSNVNCMTLVLITINYDKLLTELNWLLTAGQAKLNISNPIYLN